MKLDIKYDNHMWYSWDEYCDVCGKPTMGTNIKSSKKPDENKYDLCVDCMRKLMDNGITYEDFVKRMERNQ